MPFPALRTCPDATRAEAGMYPIAAAGQAVAQLNNPEFIRE
ncbi:hypothetical protein [Candidatus Sodalis sp. SoCistrobi]|nr:hypothetical protein [Candidatus Sodalis sp. SoCistrobi]